MPSDKNQISGPSVTLRSFGSETEASLAAGYLEQHGIKASVSKVSRYKAMAGSGYSLRVAQDRSAAAKRLLEKNDAGVDLDEYVDPDDRSYRRCPACHSVNVTKAPLAGGSWWIAFLTAGIAAIFMEREYACGKCKNIWKA